MDNGWIGIAQHPIAAGVNLPNPAKTSDPVPSEPTLQGKADPDAPVIVWHVYSGVMVERRDRALKNRFMTHWREIDAGAWIDARERKPTKEDADPYDCVISQDKWGGISMAGWHRFESETGLVRWQHPPSPPHNFRELRKTIQ